LLSPSPSPAFGPCGMPPLAGGGLVFGGAGAVALLGDGVLGGGAVVVGAGAAVDTVGWARAGAGMATGAGARTVNVVLALTVLSAAESTSRRWRPGARPWNVSRAEPDRARRRSSTYRNRCAPFVAPLSATCTVSVEAVCAPIRGERIDRCGVGALAGFAAVIAEVATGARAVDVMAALPPPQPLATRTNPKLAHTVPALNTLVTMRLPPVAAISAMTISPTCSGHLSTPILPHRAPEGYAALEGYADAGV
jgi:hypothetical protein